MGYPDAVELRALICPLAGCSEALAGLPEENAREGLNQLLGLDTRLFDDLGHLVIAASRLDRELFRGRGCMLESQVDQSIPLPRYR